MTEYIEKKAAVSYAISGMVRTLPTNDGSENWIRTSEVRKNILSIPAADVVPVVRCKDCKFLDVKTAGWGTCKYPNGCEKLCGPNDFCSCGERKES